MKKFQNKKNQRLQKKAISTSFFDILKRIYVVKDTLCFDIFTFSKAENEKIQIVLANIRV